MEWGNYKSVGQSLETLRSAITSHWEQKVRYHLASSSGESTIILLDHLPDILDQIQIVMKTGDFSNVEFGKAHGFQRAVLTQFTLEKLLMEFSLLRETMIEYLYPMGDIDCAKLVHKYIDMISITSAIQFITHINDPHRVLNQDNVSEVEVLEETSLSHLNHH